MDALPPVIEHLTRRLIAREAARDPTGGPGAAAERTCAALRGPLVRFAGVAGFRSLLTRALALAAADWPGLARVRVGTDGSLEGLAAATPRPATNPGDEEGVAVVAHLLGLLVTFIGDALTRQLVRDAWPDAPEADPEPTGEERP